MTNANLIASVAGTAAWLVGFSRLVWPSHPLLATLVITIGVYAAVKLLLGKR
ncbi:MAG: hypothetical protein KGN84_05725 [Acidobacteriota bacterium]|nr:hypothetical protein [Acidobacteriota bacterium]